MILSRAVVRLLSLLLLSFGLIGVSLLGLACVAAVLALWVLILRRDLLQLILQRIWRMRWFFLAIAVLYGLGTPAMDSAQAWFEGLYRAGVLMVLVAAVALCLHDLAAAELALGLNVLLSPLAWIGVPVAVFSRRLAATLNRVEVMDEQVRDLPRGNHQVGLAAMAQLCWVVEQPQSTPEPVLEFESKPAQSRDVILFVSILSVIVLVQTLL